MKHFILLIILAMTTPPAIGQSNQDYLRHVFSKVNEVTSARYHATIESWAQRRNSIPYTFLLSTDEVTNNYQVQLVPTFFLLDSDRVVSKVITGYRKGPADAEITATINKLLVQ